MQNKDLKMGVFHGPPWLHLIKPTDLQIGDGRAGMTRFGLKMNHCYGRVKI